MSIFIATEKTNQNPFKNQHKIMQLAVLVCVTLPVVLPTTCAMDSWQKNLKYFEKVDLNCSEFSRIGVIHSVQAWILPSGEIWQHDTNHAGKHMEIKNNGLILSIDRLDDADFGVYYCIADTGDKGMHVVKIKVNMDGPFYQKEIKHNLMVGGIGAGSTLVIFIIIWLLCTCCSPKPLEENIVELANMPNEKEGETNGDIASNMTTPDDNIYYIADGIKPANEQISIQATKEEMHSVTPVPTYSGHYHSIGSIDDNTKVHDELKSVDPATIYDQYIESIHTETNGLAENDQSLVRVGTPILDAKSDIANSYEMPIDISDANGDEADLYAKPEKVYS